MNSEHSRTTLTRTSQSSSDLLQKAGQARDLVGTIRGLEGMRGLPDERVTQRQIIGARSPQRHRSVSSPGDVRLVRPSAR